MPGTTAAEYGVWGGWLSKKPFQKELAMHGLTFDPGQRQVLLLVCNKNEKKNYVWISQCQQALSSKLGLEGGIKPRSLIEGNSDDDEILQKPFYYKNNKF